MALHRYLSLFNFNYFLNSSPEDIFIDFKERGKERKTSMWETPSTGCLSYAPLENWIKDSEMFHEKGNLNDQ